MALNTPENDAKVREAFTKGIKVENEYNREGDILPYGLVHPQAEGKLIWVCNYDQNKKIVSVFRFADDATSDKKCDYLANIERAKFFRDELKKEGWIPLVPPKVEFKMKDDKGVDKPLNREQRRFLEKKIKQISKEPIKDYDS